MIKENKISIRRGRVKTTPVDVNVICFEEENVHMAYMPSFDLIGYGNTRKEAERSLKVALDEFLRFTVLKDTLSGELKRMGWEITNSNKIPPTMSDLIVLNEQLKEIVNTKNYSTAHFSVHLPDF